MTELKNILNALMQLKYNCEKSASPDTPYDNYYTSLCNVINQIIKIIEDEAITEIEKAGG